MTDRSPPAAARSLTRRGFLVASTATLSALSAGCAAVMRVDSDAYRAYALTPGVVLSQKELAVLTALCDRMVPDHPPMPSVRDVGVAASIDRELAFHGEKLTSDVQAALFVLEHDGIAHLSTSRFTALTDDAKDERLVAMAQGNEIERQVVTGLRILVLFFYYADERTWPHIHYEGPLVPKRSPPLADSRVLKIGGG